MPLNINDTIELLTSDTRQRVNSFPYEREIRLFQLQTWIYCPDNKIIRIAGRLAAAKFLEAREERWLKETGRGRRGRAVTLRRLLNDVEYRDMFDAVIGAYGGWTKLLRTMTLKEFDDLLYKRKKDSETICSAIDYRFRYLDHGGLIPSEANITHGHYFRWSDRTQPISYRTISMRWQRGRESAILLYVSERHGFNFVPRDLARKNFLNGLTREAADLDHMQRFFGTCAYVAEKMNKAGALSWTVPSNIPRLRPSTQSLSADDCQRMRDYGACRDKMMSS